MGQLTSRNFSSVFNLFPTDIMFRDLFDTNSLFDSILKPIKINYPVDIKETDNALIIDIAAVNIDKKDVSINIDGDILKISYNKEKEEQDEQDINNIIYKGISRRAFNLGFKIAPKFKLSELKASLNKGLLSIKIPLAEEKQPIKIEIN